MKKIVLLLVVLVMGFAFTIPAAAGGNGPGGGIGPGDGTGPVGDLGPIGGNGSGGTNSGLSNGPGSGIGPGDGTGPIGGLGPVRRGQGLAMVPVIQVPQGSRGTFVMVGKIANLGPNSVTIDVIRGDKLVHPFLGTPVTVTVTPQTRYLYRDVSTTKLIIFSDLQVGQPVSVSGTVANGIWTASRITVGASLICLP